MTLDEALDRLYAADLAAFVALRKELAAALKASGDVAGSKAIAASPKPSAAAWALNAITRAHPGRLEKLLALRAEAAGVQKGGEAEAIREAARGYRGEIAKVVREAGALLEKEGHAASAVQERRMSDTLQAILAEPSPERDLLLAGRLVRDTVQEDPLAGLEASLGAGAGKRHRESPREKAAAPAPAPARPLPPPVDLAAMREKERAKKRALAAAALEAAQQQVRALEVEAREARSAAHKAEVAAARAQEAAARARRESAQVEERLEAAKTRLVEARAEADG